MSSSLSGVITSTLHLCKKHDPEAMLNLIPIFAHREKTYIKFFHALVSVQHNPHQRLHL